MPGNRWVAIDATTDRLGLARRLARVRDSVLAGGRAPGDLREVILSSWRRSRAAGVDADRGLAPVAVGPDEAAARWERHPFRLALPAVREVLADVQGDARQVVLFCDRDGTLLWLEGDPRVVDAAHGVHLEPGAAWSEAAAGTNAMGTALALSHPLQVFSAEHFSRLVGDWTCAAAPVRDPRTGTLLGVLDLSGPLGTAHPHSLAVVTAAARLAESIIGAGLGAGASLAGAGAPAREDELRIEVLGRDRARVSGLGGPGGEPVELSPRHSELVTLLVLRPEGWRAEELAVALFGEEANPVSVRAELSRLRRVLGDRLTAQPYALAGPVWADVVEVEERLGRGDAAGALATWAGPPLPASGVDHVAEVGLRLELSLRSVVLQSGDPALLEAWLRAPGGGEDLEAARALLERRGPQDPGRAFAVGRFQRLVGVQV